MDLREFSTINGGLILNTIGAILIVFSIGKLPKDYGGTTSIDNGKEYHFAYVLHPSLLKVGITLMILGFLLQIKL